MSFAAALARLGYTIFLFLLQPVLLAYLFILNRKQPGYTAKLSERFLAQVPKGLRGLVNTRRVWVHAVSVGENNAISPLVKAWVEKYPDDVWTFSCSTPTGKETAQRLFGHLKGVQFCYLPIDLPWLVSRAIRRISPDVLWVVETEIWANLFHVAKSKSLPVCLINARVSDNTAKRLHQFGRLSKPAIQSLSKVICQTDSDAAHFASLGKQVDAVAGNLKFDVARSPELVALGNHWAHVFAAQSLLLFASSREGEEIMLLDAMVRAQFFKRLPKVSVWIVPRHPQRFDSVFEQMETAAARLGVAKPIRRSAFLDQGAQPAFSHLVLGDSMGEMPAYYSAAKVALLGGSWAPLGGQNLIEACAYACPVWMGPHTFNFEKAAADAELAGAARRFDSLAQAINTFLEAEGKISEDASSASNTFSNAHVGATNKTLTVIDEVFQR